MVFSNQQVI